MGERRGQKHQRKQKQHQLMEASEELASSSVNALLAGDSDAEWETGEPAERFKEGDVEEARPLRSPFEVFEAGQPSPQAAAVGLHNRRSGSSKSVRFNGNVESFSEEPDGMQLSSHKPVLMRRSFKGRRDECTRFSPPRTFSLSYTVMLFLPVWHESDAQH